MTIGRRRRSRGGGLIACLIALLFAFVFAAPALAAPQYQSSEPQDGASLETAPANVSITFSEPLDDSSTMSVENECGREVDSGIVVVELSEMRVGITQGHYSGPYTVKYSAVGVGGVTGTTTGAFSFTVAEGHPCDGKGDGHKNHNERENNGHEHGKEKEEHGHEQVKEHGDDHSGHDGHSDDDSSAHVDHGTMGHVSTHGDHPSASGDHASHETRPGEHGEHTEHEGDEDGHQDHGARGGTLASGPLPELPADGRAALLALVLCAGLGVVGGVFLRSAD